MTTSPSIISLHVHMFSTKTTKKIGPPVSTKQKQNLILADIRFFFGEPLSILISTTMILSRFASQRSFGLEQIFSTICRTCTSTLYCCKSLGKILRDRREIKKSVFFRAWIYFAKDMCALPTKVSQRYPPRDVLGTLGCSIIVRVRSVYSEFDGARR